jgi:methyl-accepting chemotaxis protein
MMRDPIAQKTIDKLLEFPPRYKAIVEKLTRSVQTQNILLHQRAEPQRVKASDTLALLSIGASRRADEFGKVVVKEAVLAAWVNLIAGGLVILVLLAVAILSSLTIGRPIRRIAEVQLLIAGGQNTVQIPYQDRWDEVGDAARAANIFRNNLLRMQELESDKKRSAEEAAFARKEQTHPDCRRFRAGRGHHCKDCLARYRRITGHREITDRNCRSATHHLANIVSIASTEASKNVRSVAVASGQLASSIAEIGEQAERSRVIAGQSSSASSDDRRADHANVAGYRSYRAYLEDHYRYRRTD